MPGTGLTCFGGLEGSGLVLGPFAGARSSLVTAQHLVYDWRGMELHETHAAIASRRLAYWGEGRAAA